MGDAGRRGSKDAVWVAGGYYGLDQGPVVLMIENFRSGLIWRLMRGCPEIVRGLRRAGFSGGWLGKGELSARRAYPAALKGK